MAASPDSVPVLMVRTHPDGYPGGLVTVVLRPGIEWDQVRRLVGCVPEDSEWEVVRVRVRCEGRSDGSGN